jgi:hypothetical protein
MVDASTFAISVSVSVFVVVVLLYEIKVFVALGNKGVDPAG